MGWGLLIKGGLVLMGVTRYSCVKVKHITFQIVLMALLQKPLRVFKLKRRGRLRDTLRCMVVIVLVLLFQSESEPFEDRRLPTIFLSKLL